MRLVLRSAALVLAFFLHLEAASSTPFRFLMRDSARLDEDVWRVRSVCCTSSRTL